MRTKSGLEARVASVEKKIVRLYNNLYAISVRRKEQIQKRNNKLNYWARQHEHMGSLLRRIKPVAEAVKNKKRMLVTLDRNQYNTLHNILAGRRAIVPRTYKKREKVLDAEKQVV